MSRIKKSVFWVGMVLIAVGLPVLMTSSGLIAQDNMKESKSMWIWNKKFPKPTWWRWDESYWPSKPARGGYLHEARFKYIGFMNPNHWPCNDYFSISRMYERLVHVEGDLKASFPWLAESWEYKDPLTVNMSLRKGVRFHDGSEFNAESLKYQMEWILDKKNGAFSKAWIQPVKSIEVVDEYTIRWHFSKPWAAFIGMMAYVPGYIMSAEALKGSVAVREAKMLSRRANISREKVAKAEKKAKKASTKGGEKARKAAAKVEKARRASAKAEEKARIAAAKAKGVHTLDTHPVGTAQYILEEASPGNFLKLRRNPNWWFGKTIGRPDMPYFDGIKAIVIPDPAIQLANFRAAKLDRLSLSKSQYAMIKDDPQFTIHILPRADVASYLFNSARGPCQDIRVRRAISHSIDRKALIHGTQFGLARIASCMYPENHWCHNPRLKPVSYDPVLAKKLLAEAGYEKGLVIEGIAENDTESQTRVEAIKSMLAHVGIELQADSLDPVAVADRVVNLEFDLCAWNYKYVFDPDSVATTFYHPDMNQKRNYDKRAVELIEAGRKEVHFEKRKEIYHKLEKVVYDNFLDVWLWWEMEALAFRKCVQGFNLDMHAKGFVGYHESHPLWFKEGKR